MSKLAASGNKYRENNSKTIYINFYHAYRTWRGFDRNPLNIGLGIFRWISWGATFKFKSGEFLGFNWFWCHAYWFTYVLGITTRPTV